MRFREFQREEGGKVDMRSGVREFSEGRVLEQRSVRSGETSHPDFRTGEHALEPLSVILDRLLGCRLAGNRRGRDFRTSEMRHDQLGDRGLFGDRGLGRVTVEDVAAPCVV